MSVVLPFAKYTDHELKEMYRDVLELDRVGFWVKGTPAWVFDITNDIRNVYTGSLKDVAITRLYNEICRRFCGDSFGDPYA